MPSSGWFKVPKKYFSKSIFSDWYITIHYSLLFVIYFSSHSFKSTKIFLSIILAGFKVDQNPSAEQFHLIHLIMIYQDSLKTVLSKVKLS